MPYQLWFLLIVPGLPVAILLFWIHATTGKRERQFRRPFSDMPRPAGYSLQKQTDAVLESFTDDITLCMLGGMAAWAIWLSNKELVWAALVLGLAFTSYCALRAQRRVLTYANHRLGLLGEQMVGQILDRVCTDSIRVFHDLEIIEPGKKPWNIDHVVLTPAGVFAIETKSRRKPLTGQGGQAGFKVIFDGRLLRFPGPMQADHSSLEQAENNARWLSKKLTDLNGSAVQVTPVLALPGWWVEEKGTGAVSVLNPKKLPDFLIGRPKVFSDMQFKAIGAQLEERCRIDLTR